MYQRNTDFEKKVTPTRRRKFEEKFLGKRIFKRKKKNVGMKRTPWNDAVASLTRQTRTRTTLNGWPRDHSATWGSLKGFVGAWTPVQRGVKFFVRHPECVGMSDANKFMTRTV